LVGCSKSETQPGGGKANPASDFRYDLTADGQGVIITAYTGGGDKVVVPQKIEDIPVVEIGDEVFNGETFTISLKSLGGGGGLDNMNMQSKANSKGGLTSITLPNTIKKIGKKTFANTAITTFTMPDSVTEISTGLFGSSIFEGCDQLAEVRLSDNLEMVDSVFGLHGGKALKKINFPKNLKRIDKNAFLACGELTELVIPDSLISVEFGKWDVFDNKWTKKPDNDAFVGCGKLPIKIRQTIQGWGYTSGF
jgi:hypothetical protein